MKTPPAALQVVENMVVLCGRCRRFEADEEPITCVALEGGPCSACKKRATIRQKIKQLEAEITELKTRYDTLSTTANAVHDPFIHKFPPEISSHIFRLSLLSPPDFRREFSSSSLQIRLAAPLKLGHVCRMWRHLAWTTPDLWKNVYLTIGPSMRHSLAKLLPDLLREWLDRSGVHPLTISLLHSGWHHDINDSDLGETSLEDDSSDGPVVELYTLKVVTGLAIEVLDSHLSRWRNLHITAPADIFEQFYGDIQPNQLVNLSLQIFGPSLRQPLPNFMINSEFAPTQLMLINFHLASVNICWDSITHLTLHISSITSEDAVDFLEGAPRLEYYEISILPRGTPFSKHILHPRLRSLKVTDYYIEDFLSAITLPSLEEWTQTLAGAYRPVETMLYLLEQSGCYLKVLNLERVPPRPSEDFEGLNMLFEAMPSLEHIELSFESACYYNMDDILTRIFHPPEDPAPASFLPCLQSMHCICISYGNCPPFSWDRIPELYHQSHRQSLALKSTFEVPCISDDTALQLLQLTDEGVDLQIIDSDGGRELLKYFRERMYEEGLL